MLTLHAGAINKTKTELLAFVDVVSNLSFTEYQQLYHGMVFSLAHIYYRGATTIYDTYYGIGIKVPNGFVGMLYDDATVVEQKSIHFHFYREDGSAFKYIGL